MIEKCAIDGGEPVRNTPLPVTFPGGSVYGQEEIQSVLEVLENKSPFRYYGPKLLGKAKAFEDSFKEKLGVKYALGVSSGTAALITALKAAGIGPGDKVIVPASTFIASAGAVICAGAVPIFADVDDSLNIDPDAIEKVMDKYTKAVMPVPTQGNPCDMGKIMAIAKKRNLMVIEDAAQSCGSKFKGRYCGTFGDIGCFSLQLNKILTTGEGGALVTDNEKMLMRAIRYHDHGMLREKEGFLGMNEQEDIFIGQNYRMTELSGALAYEQIKKLDMIIHKMKRIKAMIKDEIKNIPNLSFRRITDEDGDTGHFIMMLLETNETTEKFIKALNAENIRTGSFYGGKAVYLMPQIMHKMTVDGKNAFPFNQFDHEIEYFQGMCPVAENLLPKNAMINLSPVFTEKDAEDIIKGIRKVAKRTL